MDSNILSSYIFGVLSIIFYSVVYYPQFYEIYKTKNIDGISVWMLLLWGQADILSLIASVLIDQYVSLIIIGWYHIFIGVLMVIYVLYYDEKYKYKYVIVYYIINLSICLYLNIIKKHDELSGSIIGWFTSIIYIIGRFPQINLNIKRQTTEGLSIWMYIFTISGNISYIISIVSYSVEKEYIILNLPWIFMTFITLFLDLFVIYQCRYYKNKKIKKNLISNV